MLERREMWRIGELNNGFFPLIDFASSQDRLVISLKTFDSSSGVAALEQHIIDLEAADFLFSSGSPAQLKVLDIRIPVTRPELDENGRVSPESDLGSLVDFGVQRGVIVEFTVFPEGLSE